MQFVDTKFIYNNAMSSSFRKPLTYKANKASELAQEACSECFDKELNEIFSSSVKYLATSAVAKELNVEKVECDIHQGDKVGASAAG